MAGHRAVVRAGGRHRRRRAQMLQVVPRPRSRRGGRRRHAVPAPLRRVTRRPRAAVRRRGRPAHRAPTLRRHLRPQPGWRSPISISRSSPRPSCASISTPTAGTSPTPSLACCRACLFSIRSCACIASTRTPAVRSRRCWPTCANCSAATTSPCSSSIMPGRVAAAYAPGRRCAARPSSTPGATAISTCAATVMRSRLSVEHRAAPSPTPLTIELAQRGDRPRSGSRRSRRAGNAGAKFARRAHHGHPRQCRRRRLPFAELRAKLSRPRRHALERIAVHSADDRPRRQNQRWISSRRRLILKTSDNHNKTGATPRLPVPVPSVSTACGNGNGNACGRSRHGRLERRRCFAIRIDTSLVRPQRSILSVPAAHLDRCRAQWRSRPARFRAAEGLVLTAASTTARWRGTGTADHHYAR